MVRRVGQLGAWAVLYVVVNQLGFLVVIVLTSAVPGEGAFSAYFYAFVLFQLPHGIYAVSVMTALVPAMAEAAARGDHSRFAEHLARGVRATAVLIVPAAAGLVVLSTPIVRLLLEQGVFTAQSTRLVAPVLTAFALGLASFSLFQLFLRAHYALQDTRTPALVNVAAVSVNVAANVTLFVLLPGQWKVVGLALGHAIAYTAGTAVFAVLLRRRLGGLGGGDMRAQLSRIGVAAAGMAVLAWAAARLLEAAVGVDTVAAQAVQVTAAVGTGLVSYLLLARALGVSDVAAVLRMVGERLRR
jgi:putative peptidoglycan lipid II flippase